MKFEYRQAKELDFIECENLTRDAFWEKHITSTQLNI